MADVLLSAVEEAPALNSRNFYLRQHLSSVRAEVASAPLLQQDRSVLGRGDLPSCVLLRHHEADCSPHRLAHLSPSVLALVLLTARLTETWQVSVEV